MTRRVAPVLLLALLFGCASERKATESPETMVPPPEPAPNTTNEPSDSGPPPNPPEPSMAPPTSQHLEKSLQAPPPRNDGGIGAAGAGATAGMGGGAPTGGLGGRPGIGNGSKR